jgi:hypothetical protein
MRARMIRSPARTVAVLSVSCLVLTTVSGCVFANNLSPVEFSQIDGVVRLAFCVSGEVDDILVEQREVLADGSKQWHSLWDAHGSYSAKTGDILILDDEVPGFEVALDDAVRPDPGEWISVDITLTSEDPNRSHTYQPIFVIPNEGLPDGVWLNYSGQTSDSPCG